MGVNSIEVLVRVHTLAVEDARRTLAHRLTEEAAAERRVRSTVEAIAKQADAAAELDACDLVVEAFGAWLQSGLTARACAEAALTLANAETARARAALTAARAAAEAALALKMKSDDDARAKKERAIQHALDDLVRPRCSGV